MPPISRKEVLYMITICSEEYHRIEDYMNEHRDCNDTLRLYEVIAHYARIYRKPNPFYYDDLTGETKVDKAVAIAAAQLYCDIPDDL